MFNKINNKLFRNETDLYLFSGANMLRETQGVARQVSMSRRYLYTRIKNVAVMFLEGKLSPADVFCFIFYILKKQTLFSRVNTDRSRFCRIVGEKNNIYNIYTAPACI